MGHEEGFALGFFVAGAAGLTVRLDAGSGAGFFMARSRAPPRFLGSDCVFSRLYNQFLVEHGSFLGETPHSDGEASDASSPP